MHIKWIIISIFHKQDIKQSQKFLTKRSNYFIFQLTVSERRVLNLQKQILYKQGLLYVHA